MYSWNPVSCIYTSKVLPAQSVVIDLRCANDVCLPAAELGTRKVKSVHAFTPITPYSFCIGGACPRGQTVVVTGADGGIGSEFCRHYASSGAQVFACRYVWNIHVRMYLQEGSLDPVLASFLVRMFI